MRVPRTAISIPGAFFGEVTVSSPPHIEEFLPLDRIFNSGDLGEYPTDLGEMLTSQGSRVESEMAAQVHTNMEDAALDSGLGPLLSECRRDACPTITHHHGRGRDAGEERLPRGCGFSGAPLPSKHLEGFGDSDQETPGSDVDAIDQDGVVGGRDRAEAGFDIPAPGGVAAELACGSSPAEIGLRVFSGQPGQESGELVSAGDIVALPDA